MVYYNIPINFVAKRFFEIVAEQEDTMLSICMITKNEQTNLERCLRRLSGFHFELVVVDTGSTDHTLEIARKYTDSVYEFAWCDDFAKAKNYAVSKARHDMVLVLDSDEYVRSIHLEELTGLIQKFPDKVGRIQRYNQLEQNHEIRESKEYINRLFNRKQFHYKGKIHEQLVSFNGNPYSTYLAPVSIGHTGYLLSEEARLQKAQRNIHLLEQELARGADPYVLSQLGKSYYMIRNYEMAIKYFGEALSFDLDPKLEYVIDMVDCYGYALLNGGHADEALSFQNIYGEFGCRADFQFLMGLIYMNNEQFNAAIQEFIKAAQQRDCRMEGVNSYLAYYNIGVIYECLGNKIKAKEAYLKCGDYVPAKKQLTALIV